MALPLDYKSPLLGGVSHDLSFIADDLDALEEAGSQFTFEGWWRKHGRGGGVAKQMDCRDGDAIYESTISDYTRAGRVDKPVVATQSM